MTFKLTSSAVLAISLISVTALAAKQATQPRWTASAGLGLMNIKAKTYIRNPENLDERWSQLNWNTNDARIVNTKIQWHIAPDTQLEFYGSLGLDGNGTLDDYDWINPEDYGRSYDVFDDWTDHSHSPTTLRHLAQFGLNLSHIFYQKERLTLSGLANYQRFDVEWEASGGTYTYSNETDGFRGSTGSFNAHATGIQERHERDSMGLGARALWDLGSNSQLYAQAIFGQDTHLKIHDLHVARGMAFDTVFTDPDQGNYQSYKIGYSRSLQKNVSVKLEYGMTRHGLIKGRETLCGAELLEDTGYACVIESSNNDWESMNENHVVASVTVQV